ncbi:MAG: GEVED domain-containing protein, partial [Bacteroidales bacterium]
DKTASALTTSAGATITPAVTWTGFWMNGYIWVDYNKNQTFEKDLETTGVPKATSELVSYTYYEHTVGSGVDSKGASVVGDEKPERLNSLPFKLPAGLSPGDYRARLIIAWNSIDPCGYSGMGGNGGSVVDFTIRIPVPSRTITLEAKPTIGGTVTGGGTEVGAIGCTAVPNAGYLFVNWTNKNGGAVVSTSATYTDNTDGNKTLIANFVKDTKLSRTGW